MKIELSFGERLAYLRNRKRVTLTQVEEHTGINRAQVSGYEKGKRNPTAQTALKLADFYGVTADFLLRGEEKKGIEVDELLVAFGLEPAIREALKKLREIEPAKGQDLLKTFNVLLDAAIAEKRKKN